MMVEQSARPEHIGLYTLLRANGTKAARARRQTALRIGQKN